MRFRIDFAESESSRADWLGSVLIEQRAGRTMVSLQINLAQDADALRPSPAGTNGFEAVTVTGQHLPGAGFGAIAQCHASPGIHRSGLRQAWQIIHRGNGPDRAEAPLLGRIQRNRVLACKTKRSRARSIPGKNSRAASTEIPMTSAKSPPNR